MNSQLHPLARAACASAAIATLFIGVIAGSRSDETPPASAQTNAPAPSPLELAERFLASSNSALVPATPAAGAVTVRLLPGVMASELPPDLPVPASARLLGSLLRLVDSRPISAEVLVDVPGDPASVASFYRDSLTSRGWTPPTGGTAGGGFQSQSSAAATVRATYCAGEDLTSPVLNLQVRQLLNGQSEARFSMSLISPTESIGPAGTRGAGTICSGPVYPGSPPMRMAWPAVQLPWLAPPADTLPLLGGERYTSVSRVATDGVWQSERSAAELEQHFADQLTTIGWTRIDGAVTGPLAWSSWGVPGEGEWYGLLVISTISEGNRVWFSLDVNDVAAELTARP
jgi:hypothetical protein